MTCDGAGVGVDLDFGHVAAVGEGVDADLGDLGGVELGGAGLAVLVGGELPGCRCQRSVPVTAEAAVFEDDVGGGGLEGFGGGLLALCQ